LEVNNKLYICKSKQKPNDMKDYTDMLCFFSEEELDEEIRVSMKSGNATQREIDAVFCR
jgi:hypothetical protein